MRSAGELRVLRKRQLPRFTGRSIALLPACASSRSSTSRRKWSGIRPCSGTQTPLGGSFELRCLLPSHHRLHGIDEGQRRAAIATVAAFLEPVEAVAFAGLLLERLAAITKSDPALAKEMSRMIDAIGQGQRRILRALKKAPRVSD